MLISISNVNYLMTKKVSKPKNKLTEQNIDAVIDNLFASLLGNNWQQDCTKKRADN